MFFVGYLGNSNREHACYEMLLEDGFWPDDHEKFEWFSLCGLYRPTIFDIMWISANKTSCARCQKCYRSRYGKQN